MKMPLLPRQSRVLLAAALVWVAASETHAADREDAPTPKKIGSRIVDFFKGLANRDAPPPGYNEYPTTSRQPRPPQGRPPRRYNLDAPPPVPGGTSPDMPPSAPNRDVPPPVGMDIESSAPPSPQPQPRPRTGDLPYESPSEEVSPRKPAVEEEKRPTSPPASSNKVTPPKTSSTKPPSESGSSSNRSSTSPSSPRVEPPSTSSPRTSPATSGEDLTASGNPTSSPPPSSSSSTVTTTPSSTGGAPLVGSKTGKPGRVKSPYPPYNELDVTGLASGSLAMDPTTKKVFRVP